MQNKNFDIILDPDIVTCIGNETRQFGKIIDTNGAILTEIYFFKDANQKQGEGMGAYCYDDEQPFIGVGPQYIDYFKEAPEYFCCFLIHELGHIMNGDLAEENALVSTTQNRRRDYLKQNKAEPHEVEADKWVVREYGKNMAIRAIQFLIAKRKIRNDIGASAAIKELELRIKAIQRIK